MSDCKTNTILNLIKCNEIVNLLDSQQIKINDDADREDLIYTNIFPYHLVPHISYVADTYILVEAEKVAEGYQIRIQTLCHSAREKMKYGGLRSDILSEEIIKTMGENGWKFVSNEVVSLYRKPIIININLGDAFPEQTKEYYMKWLDKQPEHIEQESISIMNQGYVCREIIMKWV